MATVTVTDARVTDARPGGRRWARARAAGRASGQPGRAGGIMSPSHWHSADIVANLTLRAVVTVSYLFSLLVHCCQCQLVTLDLQWPTSTLAALRGPQA